MAETNDHIVLARPVRSGDWLARTAVREGVPGIEFRSPTLGLQRSGVSIGEIRHNEPNGWATIDWIRAHDADDPVGVPACDSTLRATYHLELRVLLSRLEGGKPAARIKPMPTNIRTSIPIVGGSG